MSREPYDSDISTIEWLPLEPLIPPEKHGGPHRTVDIREVVNAIFYVLRSGCAWRLLPHDFPPWQTVYGYFRAWRKTGVWEQLNAALRDAVREQEQRQAEPSAAIMDSQSVKTTTIAGERGYDAAKSTGANGISSSTSWACCCKSSSPRPTCQSGKGPRYSCNFLC